MLQTYWEYAWRSLMQKKYFLTNLQGFLLSHFSMTAPSNWWLIVYTLWNQLLLELSLYPQQNIVLEGVYCFQHVCHSVILWFLDHLRCLHYNFDSFFFQILFKFSPHLNNQAVHVWKENRGWRNSITRVMPLCNSYNKMFVLWLIVHIFCQHLRCFLYNFESLCSILFKFTQCLSHQTIYVS